MVSVTRLPEPELAADKTRPKGFGVPEWVVKSNEESPNRVHVDPGDDVRVCGSIGRARLVSWWSMIQKVSGPESRSKWSQNSAFVEGAALPQIRGVRRTDAFLHDF